MNHLTLSLVEAETEEGTPYRAVMLRVDGVSLMELARAVETPFAQREGHPDLAGAYAWLSANPSTRRALTPRATAEDEKVTLLGCTCGDPGCWPLLARITQDASSVTWSEFEQPHRGEESAAGHWSYAGLGPFVFERELYERELDKLPLPP